MKRYKIVMVANDGETTEEDISFNEREGAEKYVEYLQDHFKALYDACEDPRDRVYYKMDFEIVEAE